jgi:hypothetical protein
MQSWWFWEICQARSGSFYFTYHVNDRTIQIPKGKFSMAFKCATAPLTPKIVRSDGFLVLRNWAIRFRYFWDQPMAGTSLMTVLLDLFSIYPSLRLIFELFWFFFQSISIIPLVESLKGDMWCSRSLAGLPRHLNHRHPSPHCPESIAPTPSSTPSPRRHRPTPSPRCHRPTPSPDAIARRHRPTPSPDAIAPMPSSTPSPRCHPRRHRPDAISTPRCHPWSHQTRCREEALTKWLRSKPQSGGLVTKSCFVNGFYCGLFSWRRTRRAWRVSVP